MDNSIFKSVFNNLNLGIAILDDNNKILHANKIFIECFEVDAKILKKNFNILHPSFLENPLSLFHNKTKLSTSKSKTLSIRVKPFESSFWLVEVEDISEQEKKNKDIYHRANFDQLTNLPNRELFNDRCKQALSSANRHQEYLAIFFIDLDNFKYINDTYGHDVGDSILLETARRLIDSVRESDTVSRWAGDEFTILLPKIGKKDDINQILSRLIDNFTLPHKINEVSIPVSLSIGISLAPDMSTQFTDLMKLADKAMYEAKESKGISYKYYSSS